MYKDRIAKYIIEDAKECIRDLESMRKYLGDERVDEQIKFLKKAIENKRIYWGFY